MLHPSFAEKRKAPTELAWIAAAAALVALVMGLLSARSDAEFG
jgi:hypothetical protein